MKSASIMRFFFLVIALSARYHACSSDTIPTLEINKITNNVYLHKSYKNVQDYGIVSSNGLIVVNDNKAFIIDTPWSTEDTIKLLSWIKSKNYVLHGSLSTHSHDDRTAGIKWLNDQSVPTYASTLTNRILKENNKEKTTYSLKSGEFLLENGLLEVFYPGGGHTIDNVVVWIPKSKILFGGCFVRSLSTNNLGYTGEAHIEEWSNSVEKTLSKFSDAKIVIPGHGEHGSIELLNHTRKLAISATKK